jgi:hypothetical protein
MLRGLLFVTSQFVDILCPGFADLGDQDYD